jgi:hypothetical protein
MNSFALAIRFARRPAGAAGWDWESLVLFRDDVLLKVLVSDAGLEAKEGIGEEIPPITHGLERARRNVG